MRFETLAVHAGHKAAPSTGDISPPIHLSTTFERAEDGSYPQGFIYARGGNPNRSDLEECLAALEAGVNGQVRQGLLIIHSVSSISPQSTQSARRILFSYLRPRRSRR